MSILVVILGWLVLSAVCAAAANARGRSILGFFCLSLFFSPIIGFLAVIAMPNRNIERERQRELAISRKCPHCAEMVKREAKICRFCGHDLPQLPTPMLPRLRSGNGALFVLIGLAVSGIIVAAVISPDGATRPP